MDDKYKLETKLNNSNKFEIYPWDNALSVKGTAKPAAHVEGDLPTEGGFPPGQCQLWTMGVYTAPFTSCGGAVTQLSAQTF